MSQRSKLKQSRNRWKQKASERADSNRYLRKQLERVRAERQRWRVQAKQAEARLCELARRAETPVVKSKVDVVWLALQLFLVVRISFRAVARVLDVLGDRLGIARAPCTQTIINWVIRLSWVRIQSPLPPAGLAQGADRFSNGYVWLIDASIGLGTGKILALLALDAGHYQPQSSAPRLAQVHCLAVAVAASWTGERIAEFLQRVIAVRGRPSAYLKDGGSDLRKAVNLLGERGLSSPCIDDLSHAVANLLKHHYQDQPMLATFLSACGRVSGQLKQTLLACLVPPKVQTKARFMNLHRLVRWADALLKLSPPGRAARGSMLEKLRTCLDRLPECKAFIRRFRDDVQPLLVCQKILKTHGLSQDTFQQCQTHIETIPSPPVRNGFRDYLRDQLTIATALGLAEIGLPISSDPIESLFGLAKQHGCGPIRDAHRIALRLPALCATPTRAEAEQVLQVSVAQQQPFTGSMNSLIQQRREVLSNPPALENLALPHPSNSLVLIPGAENRSNSSEIIPISKGCEKTPGPPLDPPDAYHQPTRAGP